LLFGVTDGIIDGDLDGTIDGDLDGTIDGDLDGTIDGVTDGTDVGEYVNTQSDINDASSSFPILDIILM
jgi:hypothetical protein